jgi:hypothetical protein
MKSFLITAAASLAIFAVCSYAALCCITVMARAFFA